MRRKTVKGICHVCGKTTDLSFEHVPPRALSNTSPVKKYSGVELAQATGSLFNASFDGIRYKSSQRGSGFQTICASCNSYFGRHHVSEYCEFSEALGSLLLSNPPSKEELGIHLEPRSLNGLAFIKHIVSNFCASSQTGTLFTCRDFLLDHKSNAFPSHLKVYLFAVPDPGPLFVTTGWTKMLMQDGSIVTASYLASFPLGYSLVDTNETNTDPCSLGCDITALAYRPWESISCSLDLPYKTIENTFPAPRY